MNAAVKIIAACQSVIARFLPPDGIREDFALQELVKILDGPEAVALTMQPASTVTQLQEAQAAMAARREVVRSFTSGQGFVAQAPHEPSEVTIVRLREELARVSDELERKRKAENDLIRDRDRLIHGDLAELHQRVKALMSHAESADNRNQEQSSIIADLQCRLHRAEEKVKGVALALAEV